MASPPLTPPSRRVRERRCPPLASTPPRSSRAPTRERRLATSTRDAFALFASADGSAKDGRCRIRPSCRTRPIDPGTSRALSSNRFDRLGAGVHLERALRNALHLAAKVPSGALADADGAITAKPWARRLEEINLDSACRARSGADESRMHPASARGISHDSPSPGHLLSPTRLRRSRMLRTSCRAAVDRRVRLRARHLAGDAWKPRSAPREGRDPGDDRGDFGPPARDADARLLSRRHPIKRRVSCAKRASTTIRRLLHLASWRP